MTKNNDITMPSPFKIVVALVFLLIALIGTGLGGCAAEREYNVWSSKMTGEASLAQAAQDRQIAVLEATAKRDSAVMEAQAEVERAKGVAQANKIIQEGLGGPDGYLHYLYINNLKDSKDQIIYVPTETGLPILEASHRPVKVPEANTGG